MYERNEFLKFDYPKNLVSTIFNEEVDNICTWKVDEVLSSLEDRQKKAMELRFKARMTYKNIGQELGVGKERASQFISYSIRRLRANRKHINLLAVPMGEHMSVQEYNKELLNEIVALEVELSRLTKMYNSLAEKNRIAEYRRIAERTPEERILQDTRIEEIGLTVGAYNALKREHINTVGDLMKYDIEQLKKVRNLGQKKIQEIQNSLAEFGIVLQ